MAVIFYDGFDSYNGTQANIGVQSRWQALNWSVAPSLITGRFGGQAFRAGSDRFSDLQITALQMPTVVGSAFTVALACRISNVATLAVATNQRSIISVTSGGATNTQVGWRPNPDGSLSVWRMTSQTAGVLLGTSAAGILLSNVWHWIDFSGTIDAATGTIILKVDGVTVLNLTAQNTKGFATNATWDGILLYPAGVYNTDGATFDIDDLYLLDSSTTLGERRVETIRPSADPGSKTWSPDTGTVNFSRINDTTVNSATYIQTATVGNIDLFDTVDLSSTPTAIDAVQIISFNQKTDAGARSIRLFADVAGVQLQSSDLTLPSSIIKSSFLMLTKPAGGSWDTSSVNSLKIGPKVTV